MSFHSTVFKGEVARLLRAAGYDPKDLQLAWIKGRKGNRKPRREPVERDGLKITIYGSSFIASGYLKQFRKDR